MRYPRELYWSQHCLRSSLECTLTRSVDDIKLEGLLDTSGFCAAIQRNLNRLEKRPDRNLMKLKKSKCKVLPLVRNNPVHHYELRTNQLESRFVEKVLGVLRDTKLHVIQQSDLAAIKAIYLLVFIRKSIPSKA